MIQNIGISQRVVLDSKTGERRDMLDQKWYDFAREIPCRLIPIPNLLSDPKEFAESLNLKALIFSGGNNVGLNSSLMISKNALEEHDVAPERENTEAELLKWAINKKIPLIGVCHGLEIINVFYGGKLISVNPDIHVAKEHKVLIKSHNWQKIYGKTIIVNSYHNKGINTNSLAPTLNAFALYNDEVEAFVHNTDAVSGIMWHPERYQNFRKEDIEFFRKFLLIS